MKVVLPMMILSSVGCSYAANNFLNKEASTPASVRGGRRSRRRLSGKAGKGSKKNSKKKSNTTSPTLAPSQNPTGQPSLAPSNSPSTHPSGQPTSVAEAETCEYYTTLARGYGELESWNTVPALEVGKKLAYYEREIEMLEKDIITLKERNQAVGDVETELEKLDVLENTKSGLEAKASYYEAKASGYEARANFFAEKEAEAVKTAACVRFKNLPVWPTVSPTLSPTSEAEKCAKRAEHYKNLANSWKEKIAPLEAVRQHHMELYKALKYDDDMEAAEKEKDVEEAAKQYSVFCNRNYERYIGKFKNDVRMCNLGPTKAVRGKEEN